MIVALSGGVGGAKLIHGLVQTLAPHEFLAAVNTGDDFEHLGLRVSPDLDTVMYTLAGVANPVTGWGLAEETWRFMDTLERLGGPTWFRLGDQDLATHVERTRRRASGESLTSVTKDFCTRLGVRHLMVPMSDDRVRTLARTGSSTLEFQHYFVRDKCKPRVQGFDYEGASHAQINDALRAALESSALEGVVICPSNPYLSIAPMLAMPGVPAALKRCRRVVAVSPIVAGKALKGPTAKIMVELGMEATSVGIARYYAGVIQTLIIDRTDSRLSSQIEDLGVEVVVSDTVMRTQADRTRLAGECIALVRRTSDQPQKLRV
jgi:LPPG:FO 2-phospho-L-lactate transferase